MPALQRTPPNKTGKSPAKPYDRPAEPIAAAPERSNSPAPTPARAAPARRSEGNSTLPATPRAFIPRVQKVMRTPPEGSGSPAMPPPAQPASSSTPPQTELTAAEVQHDTDMFVDEQIAAGASTAPTGSVYTSVSAVQTDSILTPAATTPPKSPQPRKSTTPLHPPPAMLAAPIPPTAEAGPSHRVAAPTTPAPRTPRTRRSVAVEPAAETMPTIEVDGAEQWGKRYDLTLDALQIAINKAVGKWEYRDLKGIFPLLAAKFPQELSQICNDASTSMKRKIESEAKVLFEHYRVGRALQMLESVVKDGQNYAAGSSEVRADAWRPDLSPEALTAAANLGIYDEAHERLRTEYLALHQDCSTRFSSIQAKQAQLAELETSITESVAELDDTLKMLDGFPTGEMKDWAETTMGRMEGGRVVEKA